MSNYTSVQTYVADGEENTTESSPSVNSPGVHRISISGGEATSSYDTVNRSSSEALAQLEAYKANSWRASAQNNYGIPTSTINENTVVTVGGIQSSVKAHLQAGTLISDGNGNYEKNEAIETPQITKSDPMEITSPNEMNETVNLALEPFSDQAISVAMPKAIEAIAQGADISDLAVELSHLSGVEQGEVLQRLNHIVGAYEVQANHILEKDFGFESDDRQDLYTWAHGSNQGRQLLKEALNHQVQANSYAGWQKLADAYARANPPSLEALKKANIPVRDIGGTTTIKIKGEWMALTTASKLGWI
jgi:hypothetical protein